MKKQKKKAAQKAKKALEKGVPSTDGDDEPEKESHQTCQTKLVISKLQIKNPILITLWLGVKQLFGSLFLLILHLFVKFWL